MWYRYISNSNNIPFLKNKHGRLTDCTISWPPEVRYTYYDKTVQTKTVIRLLASRFSDSEALLITLPSARLCDATNKSYTC